MTYEQKISQQMNKQELQNKIEDLEKQLAELKEQVNSPEFEGIKKGARQRPEIGEEYYYLTDEARVNKAIWNNLYRDHLRFDIGNCFKTEQEALDYRENILTKQALKDLALELNNGVEIDWDDENQRKYFFNYTNKRASFLDNLTITLQASNIYCLNVDFLDIAIDRIGEEKLIKLIKSGV